MASMNNDLSIDQLLNDPVTVANRPDGWVIVNENDPVAVVYQTAFPAPSVVTVPESGPVIVTTAPGKGIP